MSSNGYASASASFLLLLLLASFTCRCRAAPAGALVTHVPGFVGGAKLPSKHYAGYVTVDEGHGRRLFYYFVESERDPAKDPLVLWLNGGPGCSSFDGFVYEHGPFNFESGGSAGSLPKLHLNPYSWSKVSSVIYLDSPAGVGLSYSKNASDYETGDLKTAADSHTFLLKWFQLYPEFLKNPFYIAGESYAGVYVPTLSHEVVKGIHEGVKPTINFKGYMVGNGVCDTAFDGNALVPFAHGMALISDDIYKEAYTACQGNYWNGSSNRCEEALSTVDTEIEGLNIYDILEPCYHSTTIKEVIPQKSKMPQSFKNLGVTGKPLPSDEVATAWLNNDSVRSAIHAEPVSSIGPWLLCTDKLDFHHDAGSMIVYHKNLTGQGYRALIYRYTQGYEKGLTFATIKGAGHTVPEYKPQEALAFYSRWLADSKL
ncbi:Serine carboxypeptidase 1 [Dichanthelium oligosanthes]|uniref:Carboxypeptidase n=1 Tax=Dichanthelium oligosanthes TaxID=888268 RepID=A0A1E5WKE8_9POAL|nr:Serine carboxypeptidase 1 [Dichanthelium oligosanthes]